MDTNDGSLSVEAASFAMSRGIKPGDGENTGGAEARVTRRSF
jgi:hypothetical protein